MFFESSTRSTRPITARSPTISPRSASASAHSGDAATVRMSSASEARGATNVRGASPAAVAADAVKSSAQRCGVEPARAVGGHALDELARRGSRQGAEPDRRRERGVAEVHAGQVGAELLEAGRHQAQVVVLHEHGRAVVRHLRHRVGEGVVHRPVRVPRGAPRLVERRRPGQVPQPVVREPQHLVAHDVVGEAVGLRVEAEQPDAEAVGLDDPGGGRLAVPVGHGRRQPRGAGLGDERTDARHQPARAAPAGEGAVVTALEGHRAAVRHEDDRPVGGRRGHAAATVVTARRPHCRSCGLWRLPTSSGAPPRPRTSRRPSGGRRRPPAGPVTRSRWPTGARGRSRRSGAPTASRR